MKSKKLYIISIAAVLAVAALSIVGPKTWNALGNRSAVAAKRVPVVPDGYKAPPRDWLREYEDFEQLRDEIVEIEKKAGLQAKRDQLNGLASRLRAQIPAGYEWDEDTRSFKPAIPEVRPVPPPGKAAEKK